MWLSDEVRDAVDAGAPVVALESTILSHGLPFPASLDVGRALEARVREGGAVPATVAVLDGKLRAGLTEAELERVARGGIEKLGSRDLGAAMARERSGATTVSATMVIAALANVRVFATGGIGGVHRDLDVALDVSTDLTELSRTRVAVVCAGAKSILDLPRTSELLETLGVPVLGWRTDELPAFYTAESGLRVSARVEDAAEAAAIVRAHFGLGAGGVLVAVPPPIERSMSGAEVELHVTRALAAAKAASVSGKALTPFLLAELARSTGGRSVATNRALVENNAKVAATIAVALASPT